MLFSICAKMYANKYVNPPKAAVFGGFFVERSEPDGIN